MKKGERSMLTIESQYAYGDAGAGESIPPNSTLNFDVELLSWKSVKDITGDGGVIKTVVAEGKGYEKPQGPDEVLVNYTVKAGGEVVEQTKEGGEYTLWLSSLQLLLSVVLASSIKGLPGTFVTVPQVSVVQLLLSAGFMSFHVEQQKQSLHFSDVL